jgi:hypothetical protein
MTRAERETIAHHFNVIASTMAYCPNAVRP